jgi:hypothetical protein
MYDPLSDLWLVTLVIGSNIGSLQYLKNLKEFKKIKKLKYL